MAAYIFDRTLILLSDRRREPPTIEQTLRCSITKGPRYFVTARTFMLFVRRLITPYQGSTTSYDATKLRGGEQLVINVHKTCRNILNSHVLRDIRLSVYIYRQLTFLSFTHSKPTSSFHNINSKNYLSVPRSTFTTALPRFIQVQSHITMASKLIAIVAGVGAGTGASVARRFAKAYPVVLLARTPESYTELAREINKSGGKAIGISTDVSDAKSVENALVQIKKEFGEDVQAAVSFIHIKYYKFSSTKTSKRQLSSTPPAASSANPS